MIIFWGAMYINYIISESRKDTFSTNKLCET